MKLLDGYTDSNQASDNPGPEFPDERIPDEHEFHEWTRRIVNVAHRRSLSNDKQGVIKAINRLEQLLDEFGKDPHLSSIESSTVQCTLMLAEIICHEHDFDGCIEYCQDAQNIIAKKTLRYLKAGRKPRRHSLVKCWIIYTMAVAKYLGPPELENQVISVSKMIDQYLLVSKRILTGIEQIPSLDPVVDQRYIELARTTGIELIKLAKKYMPGMVQELTRHFEHTYSTSTTDRDQQWYWELEICDCFVNRSGDPSTLDELFENFQAAVLKTRDDEFDSTGFHLALAKYKSLVLDATAIEFRS